MALPATQGAAPTKRGRRSKKAKITDPLGGNDILFPQAASSDVIDIPQPVVPEIPENITIKNDGGVEIDNDDGSITIDPSGATLRESEDDDDGPGGHDENLAERIDPLELSRIANDLLDAIQQDKQDRSQWEQMRAKCIELLGMKLEDPKGDVSRSTLGVATSVVRDPVLLEAVERFRANAYAELCPSSGPVKVVNWSENKAATNDLATALEKDLNYYLTTTASEYYPDTRYMLWWTGLASGTFKKVYRCPLRNRPVSEYVDGTDLIVPASATDLKNAPRVTHEVRMARDIMRAMQLEGVYRDVLLTEPMPSVVSPVTAKLANIEGKAPQSQRVEDQEYTVFEVYCKLDVKGYEHKADGKATGLPLPYRVTIEETSRQVLEVRRNWDESDEDEIYRVPHIPFVLFPYSTGISRIYGSGLGQMMGNMASALTALLRISIDNGMMSNYPGLLKAKGTGRQLSNELMVPPGGVAEIDTGGMAIQQVVMGMPFKDVSQNVVSLIEQTRQVAQRLGGTADMPVGEGKQDAPVGTTLAMIEQATKIEGSVHKALHAAQAEEFRLLAKLFKDDPEALWRGNRRPAMGNAVDDASRQARLERFKQALDNCDIVPMADPNVPSDMHRTMMAMGIKQFTTGNPAYDPVKVDRFVAKQMFKMSDEDFNAMLAPPMMPAPNPLFEIEARKVGVLEGRLQLDAQKVQIEAMNAEKDRAMKGNIEALKMAQQATAALEPDMPDAPEPAVDPLKAREVAIKEAQLRLKAAEIAVKAANAQADRESKETVEALKIAQSVAVHPGSDPIVDEQLDQMSEFLTPASGKPADGMSDGGRVGYAFGGAPDSSYWSGMFNGSGVNGLQAQPSNGVATAMMGTSPINAGAQYGRPMFSRPNYGGPPPMTDVISYGGPVMSLASPPVMAVPEPMAPAKAGSGDPFVKAQEPNIIPYGGPQLGGVDNPILAAQQQQNRPMINGGSTQPQGSSPMNGGLPPSAAASTQPSSASAANDQWWRAEPHGDQNGAFASGGAVLADVYPPEVARSIRLALALAGQISSRHSASLQ